MSNNYSLNNNNPYVAIMIPPLLDNMLQFILNEVKRADFDRYMKWMMNKFLILYEVNTKLIYNNITKYYITISHYVFLIFYRQKIKAY